MADTFTHDTQLLHNASAEIVKLSEEYQGHVDHLNALAEEAATTVMIGMAGNSLHGKVADFQQTASQFIAEISRVGEAVGTFGNQAHEMDSDNVSNIGSVEVAL